MNVFSYILDWSKFIYLYLTRLLIDDLFSFLGVPLDLPNFKVVPGDGLYLKHVLPEQDGFYECQAISVVGSNRVVVKLNVHEAPRITRRPVKEVVVPLDGSTVLGMIL